MKKLQLILIFMVIGCYTAISQVSITKECVFCKDNEVDFKKYASAVGQNNIASGEASFAGGFGNQALDNYSIALGYNSIAGGLHSISLGSESQANGVYSIAIGRQAFATSPNAVAIGKYIESAVPSSFSFGTYLSNNAGFSFVIGKGAGNSYRLVNGIDNTLMIGFNSTLPTFFVSESVGGNDKTGRIGIGNITAPEAKLHIKADNNEDAAIKLEPTGSNYYGKILFGDDNHFISGKTGDDLMFKSETGKGFVFENGNIEIQSGYQVKTEKVSATGNKLQLYDDIGGITITNEGKVGIGTSSPTYSLTINGDMFVSSDATFLNSITQTAGNFIETTQIKAPDANGLNLTGQNGNGIFIEYGGNVGIGTSNLNADYILNVNGKILAEELKIEEEVGADFVFYDDYNLPKLEDVEKFIQKNKHLPEIPSANEMKTNGVEIGDLQIKLLQKVEELTLYLIAQQKTINQQQEQIEKQNSEIEKLKGIMQ